MQSLTLNNALASNQPLATAAGPTSATARKQALEKVVDELVTCALNQAVEELETKVPKRIWKLLPYSNVALQSYRRHHFDKSVSTKLYASHHIEISNPRKCKLIDVSVSQVGTKFINEEMRPYLTSVTAPATNLYSLARVLNGIYRVSNDELNSQFYTGDVAFYSTPIKWITFFVPFAKYLLFAYSDKQAFFASNLEGIEKFRHQTCEIKGEGNESLTIFMQHIVDNPNISAVRPERYLVKESYILQLQAKAFVVLERKPKPPRTIVHMEGLELPKTNEETITNREGAFDIQRDVAKEDENFADVQEVTKVLLEKFNEIRGIVGLIQDFIKLQTCLSFLKSGQANKAIASAETAASPKQVVKLP